MTKTQLFFAIVGVLSAELAAVLALLLHGFSDLKKQMGAMRR